MTFRSNVRRALLVLLIVGSLSSLAPSPARAACVEGHVAVHFEQGADYVVLDRSTCLVPTPFPQHPLTVGADHRHQGEPLSPGMPSGAGAQFWFPA